MRSLFLMLLGFLLLPFVESCDAPCGDNPDFDRDFLIIFDLPRIVTDYHRDSVQIFFQNGELIFPGPVNASGDITFSRYNDYDNKIPVDTMVSE